MIIIQCLIYNANKLFLDKKKKQKKTKASKAYNINNKKTQSSKTQEDVCVLCLCPKTSPRMWWCPLLELVQIGDV